jgi:hypothetical protein
MDEHLQEFVSSRGVDVRVDSAAGIIRGVKLLGLESRNGRRYLPSALAQAAALYEGAKVNVNHPKGSPLAARDYQDRLGSIRGVRSLADGLFGDLHYNPKHALAEQLAWDAVHAPENVGFSHNVEARTSRQDGRTIVEAILKVQSVDLVADPATTRSLYESADSECGACTSIWLATVTLESLCAARPDLVDAVRAEGAAELAGLREAVELLRRDIDAGRRRSTALGLFREFALPDPTSATTTEQVLAGEQFLETVTAAPDEATMRQLVEQRVQLISAARSRHSAGSKPISREQQRSEARSPALDARGFARSIS